MWGKNVFAILEIEPTNDKKTIKKAYARLVKKYHPEEQPEQWKKIHDAYEMALQMAESGQTAVSQTVPISPVATQSVPTMKSSTTEFQQEKEEKAVPVTKTEKTELEQEKEEKAVPVTKTEKTELEQEKEEQPPEVREMESLFDNIGQLSKEQQKQTVQIQQKAIQEAVAEIKRLSEKKNFNWREWEKFFYRNDILPIISTREFLYQLGDCFTNRKIDERMYKFLKDQLRIIKKYIADGNIVLKNVGISDPVGYAESKIDAAFRNYSSKKGVLFGGVRYAYLYFIGFFAVIFILLSMVKDGAGLNGKEKEEIQISNDVMQEIAEQYDPEEELQTSLDTLKEMNDAHNLWSNFKIMQYIGYFSDSMLQEALDAAVTLQDGIALWDWHETETQDIPYEIHELTVLEEENEDYHIYAFCITSASEQSQKILFCDLGKLGFTKECAIYYYDGTDYVEIPQVDENVSKTAQSADKIYRLELLEQQAFLIDTHPYNAQNPYPIVLIEPLDAVKSGDSAVENEMLQKVVEETVERKIVEEDENYNLN